MSQHPMTSSQLEVVAPNPNNERKKLNMIDSTETWLTDSAFGLLLYRSCSLYDHAAGGGLAGWSARLLYAASAQSARLLPIILPALSVHQGVG